MNLKNKKIWLIAFLALLVVLGVAIFYLTYGREKPNETTGEEQQPFIVSRRDIVRSVSLSGNLKYGSTEKLFFPVQGIVATLSAEKGETIDAGEKIASLHGEDISLITKRLTELRKNLNDGEAQLNYLLSLEEATRKIDADKEVWELREALEQSKLQLGYLTSVGESVASANAEREIRELEEALEQSKQKLADDLETPQHELSAAQMSLLTRQQSLLKARR